MNVVSFDGIPSLSNVDIVDKANAINTTDVNTANNAKCVGGRPDDSAPSRLALT